MDIDWCYGPVILTHTAYEDGHLQITCLATGTEIYSLEGHKDKVNAYS